MSDRAAAIADQLQQSVDELIDLVQACTEGQWQAICGDEGWTVAGTAHHVGAQLRFEKDLIAAIAEGAPMPAQTIDDVNQLNERRAEQYRAAPKEGVVKLLRDNSAWMSEYVRGLTDEQLDRRGAFPLAGGAEVSAVQLLNGGVLLKHVTGHLASIRAAL